MHFTRTAIVALCLAALWPAWGEKAQAQFVPHTRYGSYGWGPFVSPSAAVVDRGVMAAQKGADRRQQLGQTYQEKTQRNEFLKQQSRQNSAWIAQNQAAVDQIRMQQVQTQSQQLAAMAARAPAAEASGTPLVDIYESEKSKTEAPASDGPVRWPSLLLDPRFERPRVKLDKLLAAWKSTEAGLTSAEYQEIANLAGQMKETLRGLAPQLNAAEYLTVQEFLDDIIRRAQAAADPNR